MSFGYPVLLGSDKLAPSYRWRLLDGMFSAWRPLVEGGCAYAAASLVCLFETKNWAFLELLVGSVVLLCGRLLEARHYARVAQERRRSPEYWAMRYSVGAVAAAAMWVGMDVAAVDATEPDLPFFVLVLQSAWIGSSSPRTAAFPAAAFLQALSILAPGIIFALFAHDRFLAVFAPLNVIQLAGNVGIMRAVGAQIVAGLLSEQRLEAANAQLLELSSTDGLTGIANRRAFEALFQTEWARAARGGTDLAVLMIDVDNFKAYNDHYGHPAGDECLRLVAERAAATLRRAADKAARFGGEEFIALLPGSDGAAAVEVAERMRVAIMEAGVAHAGNAFGRVTVSIGSASLAPLPGQDRQTLIDLADRALYEAKQSGRNTVRCAGRGLRIGAWRSPVGSDGAY